MFRNLLSITSLAIALIFSSCEVPVDLDDENEIKIVVQSHFSVDQDLIAFVSKSKSRSFDGNPEYVENAYITLYSGEEREFIEELTYVPDEDRPYYKTTNLSAEVGKIYTLSVDVPGYKPITASNRIPVPVPIEDITFVNSADIVDGSSEINFDVIVSINDPIEYENFYHLLFSQEIIPYHLNIEGDTTLGEPTIFNTGKNLVVENKTRETYRVFQDFENPNFLIEDKNFNGEDIRVRFCGNYSFNPSLYISGEFSIELRTVSRAYYEHYNSVLSDNESGGTSAFTDFTALPSNVTNGVGVFAGYSSNLSKQKISN